MGGGARATRDGLSRNQTGSLALVGAALFATWVLTGAAPWIADEVMPDYHHGEAVPYQPAVVEAYADQVAREAILAGCSL